MRRRLIIILTILLMVIAIAVAIVIAVDRSPRLQNAVYKATNTSSAVTNVSTVKNTNTAPVQPPVSPDRPAVLYVARNFTELYGSYSNQNNGSNLLAAQQYASTAFSQVLRNQAVSRQNAVPPKEYSGVVTKAFAFTVNSLTASAASVDVTTQQQVLTGTTSAQQTKTIHLDLIKVGADWKVNAAAWK